MTRVFAILAMLVLTAGCSQAGNAGNSFGLIWVAAGTSATLTINAKTDTMPAAPVTVLPLPAPLPITR